MEKSNPVKAKVEVTKDRLKQAAIGLSRDEVPKGERTYLPGSGMATLMKAMGKETPPQSHIGRILF